MNIRICLLTAFAASLGLIGNAEAVQITGLTTAGTLVTFDSATPGTINSTVTLSGIFGGDSVLGIDYRPIDGLLIGLGYNSTNGATHVYSITSGGAATVINTMTLVPGLARVTADFNPTANAIRVVTSGAPGNNLRIPTGGTGALTLDSDLNPPNTGIRATAYSRNNAGGGTAGATTLYEIDGTNNALVSQGSVDFFVGSGTSPNSGTITSIGALVGVVGSAIVGFDIFNAPGTAASSQGNAFVATSTALFSLSLGGGGPPAGTATVLGAFGGGNTIVDIATVVPEPASLTLCGLAVVAFAGFGRKRRKV